MVKSITQLKKLSIAAFLAVAGLSLGGCGDLYERTDFANSVQGKSDAEVQKAVGKPASVDASNPGRVTWTYNSATFDVNNANKRDAKTIVVFKPEAAGGKLRAAEILYE